MIDMGPLLRGETSCISIDYTLVPEPMDDMGVKFTSDAHVTGSIKDNAGYMRLTLKAELPYSTECARCLAEVRGVYKIGFERTVVAEGMLTEQQLADNVDEYAVIKNGMLDIDEELKESLILEFPLRILCSEDCPGLCPVCGKPKREGCGCVEKNTDPRLAVLSKLLDEMNADSDGSNNDNRSEKERKKKKK